MPASATNTASPSHIKSSRVSIRYVRIFVGASFFSRRDAPDRLGDTFLAGEIEFVLDARDGAEELAGGVSHDGGAAVEVGSSYWQEKHLRLDERLRKTGAR